MFKGRARSQAPQLGLNHRAQITWGMMTKFDHAAGLTFENDYHASSDLGCWNCHCLCFLSDCVIALKGQKTPRFNKPGSLAAAVRHCPAAGGTGVAPVKSQAMPSFSRDGSATLMRGKSFKRACPLRVNTIHEITLNMTNRPLSCLFVM